MQILNSLVANATPWIPRALIHRISRRYIAGNSLADAVARIRELNAQGFAVTIDVLGETTSTLRQACDTADEYFHVIEAIHDYALDATISVKPTALGLLLDVQRCEQMLLRLADAAGHYKTAVCMDMEDIHCTQLEIDIFTRLKTRNDNVSLALQAYLNRTYQDLESLLGQRSNLRICKGIYREGQSHLVDGAWSDRRAINPHYLHHVGRCFEAGTFVGIATHDEALIEQVITLAKHGGVDRKKFEFQMLLGVCEPLRDKLRDMGYGVRIYVPYGSDWYNYSIRRMKENPQIAGYVARSLMRL
jgi:proline dehydrogenase